MPWKRPAQLRQKVLPMKVLNLGMSRTGTTCSVDKLLDNEDFTDWMTAMCTALETLGCKACYHLDYDSDDCAFWLAAMEAKYDGKGKPFGREEWDHIFAEYDAISDLPAILFGPELAAAYPQAKILLTVRDVEPWHRSMLLTVCNPIYQGWYHRFPALFFSKEQALCRMSDKCEQITWRNDCKQYGKQYYLGYNDEVRQLQPNETNLPLSERRFLEWQLGEGWDRLAEFLGSEVPNRGYPSGNGVTEFVAEADLHAREMWAQLGYKFVPWLASAVGGLAVLRLLRKVD